MVDGLLFTSPNGVTGFLDRAASRGTGPSALRGKRIYAVGEATAKAVGGYGLTVTAMPERFTAAELAKAVSADDLKGLAFLFPTGSLTSVGPRRQRPAPRGHGRHAGRLQDGRPRTGQR